MTTASVSASALRHNLSVVRQRVAPVPLMAVVKDDAYGHGIERVIPLLASEGVTRFGTLDLEGAGTAKRLAPAASVFAWVIDRGDDIRGAIEDGVDLGVSDAEMLECVAAASDPSVGRVARIHLKVDSGLHRAGVLPHLWSAFVERAATLETDGRVEVVGVWTHIAEASEEADTEAIRVFQSAVRTAIAAGLAPAVRHLAASAAAFSRADARFDQVRVGAFLYGIAPGGGLGPGDLGLRPAMTLTTPVREVLNVGGRRVARVAFGGAHGLLADAAGGVTAAVRGVRHPFVAVTASHADLEVSGHDVADGDEVTLFGPGDAGEPSVNEWADAMGTIGEEVVTRLSPRIQRVWTG